MFIREGWIIQQHAAQFVAISTICSVGNNIISTSCLYGGTYIQLKVTISKLGSISNSFKILKQFVRLRMIREYRLSLIILLVLSSGYLIKLIEHGADILLFIAQRNGLKVMEQQ
ncbi:uncharacterized protein OCT59_006069 [Rhizophagus irregularis]|uniref:uncharacterized protein n=1 Tax=Rhizophagus irregularis TaxID=588596 RepID=UPI003333C05E|nr:hypothetical protein OCT59_006069 [Rhizophagus irregularis]